MANSTSPNLSTDLTSGSDSGGRGKTMINDTVVAKVVGIAALEVSGVHTLVGGPARALGRIRDALTTDVSQAISIEVDENRVAADITIDTEYPAPLQDVADRVRSAVIRAVEEQVGMEVTDVNVKVNDVHLPTDDTDEKPEERAQ